MGRKSNAKKVIRDLVKDKDRKKKNKKQLKKEVKKGTNNKIKKQASTLKTERTIAIIVSSISLIILLPILIFLMVKMFQAKPVAKLLPADKTILSLELNIDFNHLQNIKGFKLLQSYPFYSKDSLVDFIENRFLINFEDTITPWLGRKAALAVIKGEEYMFNTIYFIETLSPQKTLESFNENLGKSQYDGNTIYFLKQDEISESDYPKYFTFIDDYFIMSFTEEGIKTMISSNTYTSKKLYNSQNFQNIENKLALNKLAYLYIDFDLLRENYLPYISRYLNTGLNVDSLETLLKLFVSEGIVMISKDDNFLFNSFIKTKSQVSGKINGLEKPYEARLLSTIPEDVIAIWGGENLENKLENLTTSLGTSLDYSTLNQITKKYFGTSTDFQKNILPLFRSEFLVFISQNEKSKDFSLILELINNTEEEIDTLITSLIANIASYKEETRKNELEDGTIYYEVIAVPENIPQKIEKFTGYEIKSYKVKQKNIQVAYTFMDGLLVMSTNTESIKKIIQTYKGENVNFKNSEKYKQMILPVIDSADELMYVDLHNTLPIFLSDMNIPEFIVPFESFSSGKNYFNGGISTINFLSTLK